MYRCSHTFININCALTSRCGSYDHVTADGFCEHKMAEKVKQSVSLVTSNTLCALLFMIGK